MADGISFKMVTEPFDRWNVDRQKRMARAAMWAVRQGGRETKREARARAPVLKDANLLTHRQLQRRRRAGQDVSKAYERPVPGLLKASISSSRRLKNRGKGEYSLKVGPRGERTHLYAQKMEARYGYMTAADRVAAEALQRIARQAFDRVWKG